MTGESIVGRWVRMVIRLTWKNVSPSEINQMDFDSLSFWYDLHAKIDKARSNG